MKKMTTFEWIKFWVIVLWFAAVVIEQATR